MKHPQPSTARRSRPEPDYTLKRRRADSVEDERPAKLPKPCVEYQKPALVSSDCI